MIATVLEGLRETPLFDPSISTETRWRRDLRMSKAAFANGPGAKASRLFDRRRDCLVFHTGIMLRPQLVIHAACAPVCVEAANWIERGEEMRRLAAMALCLILCGCGTSDDKPVGLEVRPLSAAEQDALRRSFSV